MSLRINALNIENVGCFKKMVIRFNGALTIICGENGIGKTTILESIAAIFLWNSRTLTRNANVAAGTVTLSVSSPDAASSEISAGIRVDRWLPEENRPLIQTSVAAYVREFLYIKANRDLIYSQLSAIGRDPERDQGQIITELGSGLQNGDLKSWFVNRYMFLDKIGSLDDLQKSNYNLAIECMSVLEPNVRFANVDASRFNIMVDTPDGIIPIEFLSSGYRATFYIILGIIKELEYRKLPNRAADFAGVIMIDEIDLHLHPTWQRQIVRVLRATFPAAQFIMTTHSPHVIQAAENGEVIALVRDEEGRPSFNPLPELPYGFQGWTVEEILEDVMRLPTTKSPLFESEMRNFDQALGEENQPKVAEHLATLEQMLHPNSPFRKLLRLQAAPVLG